MAKAPAKKTYKLEVKGPVTPTYFYGDVAYLDKEKSYKLLMKRPRTSKLDEYIIPEDDVIVASEGEKGYIYTESSQFDDTISVLFTLSNGTIDGDIVTGVDDDTGNTISVNRKLIKVEVRKAAYDV